MFERIDVLGANDFTFALTAHARARGWDAAFGPGVLRVGKQGGRGYSPSPGAAATGAETGDSTHEEGQSGRGERIGADTFQLSVRIIGGSLDSARVERSA